MRENALQAVREGGQAETNLAAAARKEAEARAARAEEEVTRLRLEVAEAEERVEEALQQSRRAQEAAQKRYAFHSLLTLGGEISKIKFLPILKVMCNTVQCDCCLPTSDPNGKVCHLIVC
jgi:hypothetical protein